MSFALKAHILFFIAQLHNQLIESEATAEFPKFQNDLCQNSLG